MAFPKTPPALFTLIQKLLAKYPCDFRPMFGSAAYFVQGNMFAGAFAETVFLRLAEQDRKKIIATHSEIQPFEPLPGRIMKEYVAIPEGLTHRMEIQRWIQKSHAYALGLPPKSAKPAAKKKVSKK